MQMTPIYTCVRILAEAVASLPLHLYQEKAGTTVCPIFGRIVGLFWERTSVPVGAQVTAL